MPRAARTVPRRKPRQKRAEDTVTVLLEATERVFAQKGFHAATTNQIARVAGVSIGTLYHYFPTKEALVSAVVHRMWEGELTAVMAHADAFAEEPLEIAIRRVVKALVDEIGRKIELYRSWYTEASHLGELNTGLAMTNQAVAFIQSVLEHKRAEVRPHDLAFAADLVVKTALAVARTGARDYAAQVKNGELAEELADMLSRYLLR
jgi:AcrR family transcriptional regulator